MSEKYIARIDSDDTSMSGRIQKQYNYMEKNKDVTCVVVFLNPLREVME